jgi:hypothetical protein
MQDNHDVWNNSMDLAGIQNGGIVGFKYFGFGGLAKATKGVPAFEGAKKGDQTHLCLALTPGGRGAFKIRVMLDGPYANSTWNGREIGVVEVPADAPKEMRLFTIPVPAVEGLSGKHAIYLIAEGPEIQEPQNNRQQWGRRQQPQRPQGLFDLHGIGFSKHGPMSQSIAELTRVPKVTICIDGQPLVIPSEPLRSNNLNGYTAVNHYQVYGRFADGAKLTATADDPAVKIEVSPIADGRATVRAVYRGQEKVFLIN